MSATALRLPDDPAERLHRLVLIGLQAIMAVGLALAVWRGHWQDAAIVVSCMGLTLSPLLLPDRLSVRMPYVFQIMVVLFVFASVYLGSVVGFYVMFPWWDSFLHFSSGLLVGVLGFMLVYLLDAEERIGFSAKPGLVAVFAFCLAMAFGALWEIVEFALDQVLGTAMQTPTPSDPSGLGDTMWDLIFDATGALLVALYGYSYLRRGARSLIGDWIDRFVRDHPDWPRPRQQRG